MRRFTQPGKRVASFTRTFARMRWALMFDGVGVRGVLASRAINPDGDIDIEFQTGTVVPVAGGGIEYTVLSQCLTATFASKEFNLYFNSAVGALQMQVGGAYSPSSASVALSPNTTYRALFQGTSLQLFKNGQLFFSTSFTRGAAREPTAATVIGASTHGSPTTFRASARGIFYNIKINGTLWPIADANQTVQLPEPSGLGAELITQTVLENPYVKGTQWTYLGGGRWQYIGDGTLNDLIPISFVNQPNSAYLEFEIESIAGLITCNQSASAEALFSSAGVKRYFFSEKGADNIKAFTFKRASGAVTSCIIKNISFKPLGTCIPLVIANATSANWKDEPL